jgi:hypothetical protein
MRGKQKLNNLVKKLKSLGEHYHLVLDKYSDGKGNAEYFLKLQFEDVEINIEKIFSTVYHGPPKSN